MATDFLSGLAKGLSGFLPQDDPDVKILNAQAKQRELQKQIEAVYTETGRMALAGDGASAYPQQAQKLALLSDELAAARGALEAMQREKAAADAAVQARREACTCTSCGAENPEGTKFCRECGAKLGSPAARFCTACGAQNAAGVRFCGACGARLPEE